MSEIEILEEELLGNFYSRISLGDTFDLYFGNFWLIAQNVVSPDEVAINNRISEYSPASEAVDKDDVAKSTILTATLRKKITKISLNSDSSLELNFENGVKLTFTTDTEVVDWQWAINDEAQDPYLGCLLGVFDAGKVHLGNC